MRTKTNYEFEPDTNNEEILFVNYEKKNKNQLKSFNLQKTDKSKASIEQIHAKLREEMGMQSANLDLGAIEKYLPKL